MLELINIAMPYIMKGLGALLGIVALFVFTKINKYAKEKFNESQLSVISIIVKNVVHCVEQTFKDLHGEDKLNEAKNKLINLLEAKGIKLTDEEINILIESAVNQMNKEK